MLSDYQVDDLAGEEVTFDDVLDKAISAWKCPHCKRLTFFDELNKVTEVYTLENSNRGT